MKKIKVKIALDGSTSIEAEGFTNAGCHRATRPIEEALAGGPTEVVEKPEAMIAEQDNQQGLHWS